MYQGCITPEDLVGAFESCALPAASFRHREHLLVAWTYLRALPFPDAAARFRHNLRRFAEHHGAKTKYDEAVTAHYLALLHERVLASPGATFEALLAASPELLARRQIGRKE
jgi:hypothetical protein